jgi:heat shock protein HslJ
MLVFDINNKVTGKVGCNTLKADYQLSNNLLSVKDVVTTQSDCANPELDTAFVNDLNRAVNFEILEDLLVLQLDNNAGLMYFDKVSESK